MENEKPAQDKRAILKKLFFSTLYLSTFTFGGGYVIVSLLKTKFVDELHWIDENEMHSLRRVQLPSTERSSSDTSLRECPEFSVQSSERSSHRL